MSARKIRIDTIGKLDVNMLVALQIVLAERSVGKAAAEIGLSQPAMSNALARMRVAFDDPLLVRSHGRMELTVRGQEVLDQLEVILPQVERLAQPSAFDPRSAQTLFHIACNDLSVQLITPDIVRIVAQEASGVKLNIGTLHSRELDQEDTEVSYDLRIGWFNAPPPSWFIRKLFEDEMVVVADVANPLVSGDVISAEQFSSSPHAAIRMHHRLDQSGVDKALQDVGMVRRITVWLSNFNAISRAVVHSNLIALVPMSIARTYASLGQLRIMRLPKPIAPLRVSMAWTPTVHYDPANRWLRSVVVRASEAFGPADTE